MANCNEDFFNELEVSFKTKASVDAHHQKMPAEVDIIKSKRFNSKLKIYREFALATLSTLAREKRCYLDKEDSLSHFYALDAYSGTGIAALQWKKHLQDIVHVTAADTDVCLIQQNAKKNLLMCSPWQLDPIRVPGDPKASQTENEIFSCQAEARAVMTMETFHFVYLSPLKNNGASLDPAFHSLNSDGVLCLVVPDLSIFARAPHVVQRCFSAQVIKTEYLKEVAARTVLAEAARAAAKHSKGISVLYVVSQDDYLLITLQVQRGQKAVASSLNNVCQLLHCRFCEERVFLSNQLAPHENVYDLLACACRSNNLGKTAVVLGPMWKGCIFNSAFLKRITKEGSKLKLSAKFFDTASLLLTESMCSSGGREFESNSHQTQKNLIMGGGGNTEPDNKISQNIQSNVSKPAKEFKSSSNMLVLVPGVCTESSKSSNDNSAHRKRKASSEEEESLTKTRKTDYVENAEQPNVPFYYSVSRSKKGVSLKLNKLVTLLHKNNYQASRTHFDPCAIRTSANVQQFVEFLD